MIPTCDQTNNNPRGVLRGTLGFELTRGRGNPPKNLRRKRSFLLIGCDSTHIGAISPGGPISLIRPMGPGKPGGTGGTGRVRPAESAAGGEPKNLGLGKKVSRLAIKLSG